MKTIRTRIDGKKVIGEVYMNASEFIDVIGKRPHVFDDRDFFADDCEGDSFYGFDNGKQLKADFLKSKVSDKALNSLKACLRPRGHTGNKIKYFNNVQGFTPIVPLAILGIPTSMLDQRVTPVKAKIINLNVCVSVCACYTIEKMAEGGRLIFESIMGLEQSGYRVNLTVYSSYVTDNEVVYMGLKIKEANQPLDIARCAYPFINPSFERGVGFAWYQRTDGIKHSYGYGAPLYNHSASIFEKSLADQKNSVFIYLSDVLHKGQDAIDEALSKDAQSRTRARA